MARRKREESKQKVDIQKSGITVVADQAIIQADTEGVKKIILRKKRRARSGSRVYESIPGWGRSDVPVGKGTIQNLNKSVPQTIAKTALTEVE